MKIVIFGGGNKNETSHFKMSPPTLGTAKFTTEAPVKFTGEVHQLRLPLPPSTGELHRGRGGSQPLPPPVSNLHKNVHYIQPWCQYRIGGPFFTEARESCASSQNGQNRRACFKKKSQKYAKSHKMRKNFPKLWKMWKKFQNGWQSAKKLPHKWLQLVKCDNKKTEMTINWPQNPKKKPKKLKNCPKWRENYLKKKAETEENC